MPLYESRVFKAKRQLKVVQIAFANYHCVTQNVLEKLVAFDKTKDIFSLTYAQKVVQQLRQLNIYCHQICVS